MSSTGVPWSWKVWQPNKYHYVATASAAEIASEQRHLQEYSNHIFFRILTRNSKPFGIVISISDHTFNLQLLYLQYLLDLLHDSLQFLALPAQSFSGIVKKAGLQHVRMRETWACEMAAPHFTCFKPVVGKVGLQLVGGTGRPSGSIRYGRGTGAFRLLEETGLRCGRGDRYGGRGGGGLGRPYWGTQRRSFGGCGGGAGRLLWSEGGGDGDYNSPPTIHRDTFCQIFNGQAEFIRLLNWEKIIQTIGFHSSINSWFQTNLLMGTSYLSIFSLINTHNKIVLRSIFHNHVKSPRLSGFHEGLTFASRIPPFWTSGEPARGEAASREWGERWALKNSPGG